MNATLTANSTADEINSAASILLVEDDEPVRKALADALRLYGHDVNEAADCEHTRRMLRRQRIDVVLLDIGLPDDSGYDLLREIRVGTFRDAGVSANVPVVMLSGHGGETERVRAFELGCDDYVIKPYSFSELRGRLAALLRRTRNDQDCDVQRIGELTIDHRMRDVRIDDQTINLTIKEWDLLVALASDPTRVFTRDQLLRTVWGFRSAGSTRTLDAHACRLRAKLAGGKRRYVVNLWGVGYRLFDPVPGATAARRSVR